MYTTDLTTKGPPLTLGCPGNQSNQTSRGDVISHNLHNPDSLKENLGYLEVPGPQLNI